MYGEVVCPHCPLGLEKSFIYFEFYTDFFLSLLFTIFIAYPLFTFIYPYIYRKYNWTIFEDTVMEYTITIKILKVSVILCIISIIFGLLSVSLYSPLDYFYLSETSTSLKHMFSIFMLPEIPLAIFRSIQTILWLVVGATLMKIISLITRKDFRLDFAIGCIKLIPKSKDENEKIKWLFKGLCSYNIFVNKQLKININIFKIFSKIINSPLKERNDSIQTIYKAF